MNVRINSGYIITDSIHMDEAEFVLGVHQSIPNKFVTWRCKDQTDYMWGHYFSGDRLAAVKDLCQRATEHVQFLESVRGDNARREQARQKAGRDYER